MLAAWWLLTVAPLSAAGGRDEPPAEVEPFVPEGFDVLDFATGDLDGDGRADVALILASDEEYNANADGVPRPLLLLTRQADGRLKLALRNDRLVPCRSCGGKRDPYGAITVGRASLNLRFTGVWPTTVWSDDLTFVYHVDKKDWFLDRERYEGMSLDEDDGGMRRYSIPRSELGDVPLRTFDLSEHKNEQQTTWRVVAKRARFYDHPDLKSKPRRAYVVRGDHVVAYRELRNFVETEFHDGNHGTFAFLRKADLERLSPAP